MLIHPSEAAMLEDENPSAPFFPILDNKESISPPDGYLIRETIKGYNPKRDLLCVLALVIAASSLLLYTFLSAGASLSPFVFVGFCYALPLIYAHILLSCYIKALVLRSFTGHRLTWGFHRGMPYAALPDRFIEAKVAIRAEVLSPATLLPLSTLLLLLCFNNSVFAFASIYVFSYSLAALVYGVLNALMINRYRTAPALINDCGDRLAIFTKGTDDGKPNHDWQTAEYLAWLNEEGVSRTESDRGTNLKENAVALVTVLLIGTIIFSISSYFHIHSALLLKYYDYSRLLIAPVFYILILFASLLIYHICSFKKHYFFKRSILLPALSVILLIGTAFSFFVTTYISSTTVADNYGSFDPLLKQHELLPKDIGEDMTAIKYSYYYSYGWDTVYEIYLEVRMDEEAYGKLKSQYEDRLASFAYAEGYLEYALSDKMPYSRSDEVYTNQPDIEKIIFCDSDLTVIYEIMYGFAPFYYEDSAYIERFNINPKEYISISEK